MQEFSIGDLMRITGLSRATILYYEQKGLVHPVQRESSGYRYYSTADLAQVMLFQNLKQMDVSVGEYVEAVLPEEGGTGDIETLLFRKKQECLARISANLAMVKYWDQFLSHMHLAQDLQEDGMEYGESLNYPAYTLDFSNLRDSYGTKALSRWDDYFLQRNLSYFFSKEQMVKHNYCFSRGLSCYADCALELPEEIRRGLHYIAPRRCLFAIVPFDYAEESFDTVFEKIGNVLKERNLVLDGDPWGNFSVKDIHNGKRQYSLFLWIPIADL